MLFLHRFLWLVLSNLEVVAVLIRDYNRLNLKEKMSHRHHPKETKSCHLGCLN